MYATAARSRTPEARHKARWFTVHRWLGIALGAWFALVGLTSSILVYEDPIDAWLNPALLTSRERGPWLPPEQLLARIEAEHDLGRVEQIRPPPARSTGSSSAPSAGRRHTVRAVSENERDHQRAGKGSHARQVQQLQQVFHMPLRTG